MLDTTPWNSESIPVASVVVCTFNRAEMLKQALTSLVTQKILTGYFEIVVIDDGSSDNTSEVVEEVSRQSSVPIVYVRQPNAGIGNARNRGIQTSRALWIAFFDDDELASETWLRELLQTATETGADCVGGPCVIEVLGTTDIQLTGTVGKLLGQNPCMLTPLKKLSLLNRLHSRIARINLPGGGNVLIRKSLLESLGGFRQLRYGEDLDLFRRASVERAVFATAPGAIVHHVTPPYRLTPTYLYSQAQRGGASQAAIDARVLGAARLLFLSALRTFHLVTMTVPLLFWHFVMGHKSDIVARLCSLRFATAYLGQVIAQREESC